MAEEEVSTEEVVSEEETTQEAYDVEEDVNVLLGGEELSEEFERKAEVIFESALNSKGKRNSRKPGNPVWSNWKRKRRS